MPHLIEPISLKPWPPRSWPRSVWKWYHRESRLCARESAKVFSDAVLYGAGFTRIDAGGVKHVPYWDVMK